MKKKKLNLSKLNHHTLEETKDEFIQSCKEKGLATETIKTYLQNVDIFIECFGSNETIESLSIDDMESFKKWLINHRNFNSVSINTTNRCINQYLKFISHQYHLSPLKLDYVKEKRELKQTFSDDDIKILTKKPNLYECQYSEYRDYICILLAINTGARASSIVNVKKDDIDFKSKTITYRHMKNGKPQTFPLNNHVLKEIKEYLSVSELHGEYLFENSQDKPLTAKQLSVSFRRYCMSRGIKITSFHSLRAKFATVLIKETGDVFLVMKALNHSNPTVTMRYLQSLGINDYEDSLRDFNILNKLKGW